MIEVLQAIINEFITILNEPKMIFYALSVMWDGLQPSQQADLLKIIITTVGVLFGAITSIVIFAKTKQKEINFKIHEQRKNKYEEYLNLIQKIVINSKEIQEGENPFTQDDWINIQFGLTLYASDKVIEKTRKVMNVHQNTPIDQILFELGDLIRLMRKEIGLNNGNLTPRECLSTFINDIYDKKYDKAYKSFKKRKNLINTLLIKFERKLNKNL